MTERVSIDDLGFAADWMETYDPSPGDDENAEKARRVAAWLRREIASRQTAEAVSEIVRRTGATRQQARSALRRVTAGRPKDGGGPAPSKQGSAEK